MTDIPHGMKPTETGAWAGPSLDEWLRRISPWPIPWIGATCGCTICWDKGAPCTNVGVVGLCRGCEEHCWGIER